LPTEPQAPADAPNCKRSVTCNPELGDLPESPFPAPFARCSPDQDDGKLSVKESRRARIEDPKACCYVSFQCSIRVQTVIGRPLRSGGRAVAARVVGREGWTEPSDASTREAPSRERGSAAATPPAADTVWAEIARLEHASVAAFAALSLDLLALGAPADLVERAHQAALDEIAHARAAFALASRDEGGPRGPGAMALPARPPATFERVAVETFLEGCVGETCAAIVAACAAEGADDAPSARALARIADDEARHAELAWRVLRWTREAGGESVTAAVLAARARMRAAPPGAADADETDEAGAYGVLDRARLSALRARSLAEVIDPCLAAWAAAPSSAQP
jgi:hypothetical protein